MDYEPQLPTLAASPPSGDAWLHELKLDGYRAGCTVDGPRVRLISRNGKDWPHAFPELEAAVKSLQLSRALFDGELAVVLPDGRTSFQGMQNAADARARGALVYFAFDLLELGDRDLRAMPLEHRKAELRETLRQAPSMLRFVDHVIGGGDEVFRRACALGVEGIVSKRRDRPHRRGRSTEWLKIKCVRSSNFVIGGFTDPAGARAGIGAMLLGYYDLGGELVYAGSVGTGKGFTAAFLEELRRGLESLEVRACPFARRSRTPLPRRAHWVRPELVASVTYLEFTRDGHLRHPSFLNFVRGVDPRTVGRGA